MRQQTSATRAAVAVVRACGDAARAWRIAPHLAARSTYVSDERTGTRCVSRRPYTTRERLMLKCDRAASIWWNSLRVRLASRVSIPILRTEGLMANLMHVLEVLHRVRPDAEVVADWVLGGDETAFRYGRPGENVWDGLFRPLGPLRDSSPHRPWFQAGQPLDLAFWGIGKDYLAGPALARHRESYHRTFASRIEIVNARVNREADRIRDGPLKGRFCIGVHRRVGNAMVQNLQRDGDVPSLERIVDSVRAEAGAAGAKDWAVYLATDDDDAVRGLTHAFGSRLVVREHVQRTTAGDGEVHSREWGRVSLADAEDVLIDAMILARSDVLVHASSSISTAAGVFNPSLRLIRAAVHDPARPLAARSAAWSSQGA